MVSVKPQNARGKTMLKLPTNYADATQDVLANPAQFQSLLKVIRNDPDYAIPATLTEEQLEKEFWLVSASRMDEEFASYAYYFTIAKNKDSGLYSLWALDYDEEGNFIENSGFISLRDFNPDADYDTIQGLWEEGY